MIGAPAGQWRPMKVGQLLTRPAQRRLPWLEAGKFERGARKDDLHAIRVNRRGYVWGALPCTAAQGEGGG